MPSNTDALTRVARALQRFRPDFTLTNAKTFARALSNAPDGTFGGKPLTWLPGPVTDPARSAHTENPMSSREVQDMSSPMRSSGNDESTWIPVQLSDICPGDIVRTAEGEFIYIGDGRVVDSCGGISTINEITAFDSPKQDVFRVFGRGVQPVPATSLQEVRAAYPQPLLLFDSSSGGLTMQDLRNVWITPKSDDPEAVTATLRSIIDQRLVQGWGVFLCSMDPALSDYQDRANVVLDARAGMSRDPEGVYLLMTRLMLSLVNARRGAAYQKLGDWNPVMLVISDLEEARDNVEVRRNIDSLIRFGGRYRVHVVQVRREYAPGQADLCPKADAFPAHTIGPATGVSLYPRTHFHDGYLVIEVIKESMAGKLVSWDAKEVSGKYGLPIRKDWSLITPPQSSDIAPDALIANEYGIPTELDVASSGNSDAVQRFYAEMEKVIRSTFIDTHE